MSEELFAVSTISPAPAAQSDYDSICAALMQTERGRWFLEEYAKRNRSADTRILLGAIQRIETVVCADRSERDRQAQQGFRTDLLEMAKAITRTRAEVAEIPSGSGLHPGAAGPDGEAEPPPRSRDVFSAAERIRDVTWAMRGHGFDPSTCDQLEELAASILSASALRDPTDRRTSKLSEVLQYLEHRIETLLVGSHDGEAAEAAPEPQAALSAPAAEAEPVIELPATAPPELAAVGLATDVETPPPDFLPALCAAHDDLEGDAEVPQYPPPAPELEAAAEPNGPVPAVAAVVLTTDAETSAAEADASAAIAVEVAIPTAELATQSTPMADDAVEAVAAFASKASDTPDLSLAPAIDLSATDAEPEPPVAETLESQAEDSISLRIQEVEAQSAEPTSASEPSMTDGVEPESLSADHAPPDALSAPDPSLDLIIEADAPAADGAAPESELSATDAEPEPAPTEAGIREAQAESAEPASPSGQSAADEVEPTSAFADEAATVALAADAEPAVASSPLPDSEAAPTAEAAPDDPLQAEPPSTTPEPATGSEAPSAPAMDPGALTADPETRMPAVDMTYATPWLPDSSGPQPAAALLAVDAFLPEMHMRVAMLAAAPAGGVLQAAAVSLEIAAAAPAPACCIIMIDLDEAGWAALGPPEPDHPPPSPAAPQPKAAEDIPAWQIQVPKPAEAAEFPSAPALGAPAPAATAPAQAAAAPMPQPLQGDPLAALKVMSAEELIALFS
jgi:hypothetical protein